MVLRSSAKKDSCCQSRHRIVVSLETETNGKTAHAGIYTHLLQPRYLLQNFESEVKSGASGIYFLSLH